MCDRGLLVRTQFARSQRLSAGCSLSCKITTRSGPLYLMLTTLLAAWNLFMGFPKGALASPLVKGGVKTPPAKWHRLFSELGVLCVFALAQWNILSTEVLSFHSRHYSTGLALWSISHGRDNSTRSSCYSTGRVIFSEIL